MFSLYNKYDKELRGVNTEGKCGNHCKVFYLNTVFDLNYRTYPISAQSSNFIVFTLHPMYLYLLLYKNLCYGYSFELP